MLLWTWMQQWARKATGYEQLREIAGLFRSTKSGKSVTVQTALEVATVLACARVISEGIAQVPLKLFQVSDDDRVRLPAKTHSLYKVLFRRPNPWQTSFEYRETIGLHAVLCGNHYSFINRSRGNILELIPFQPGQVRVKRANDWSLSYEVTAANGKVQPFPQETIWHVKGPSWNSWMGLEAVTLAREAIGLSMALEEHQANLHKQGAKPAGLISVEGTMQPDQYDKLRKWIDDNIDGLANVGKTALLDRAGKWSPFSPTGVDSQHLETRKHQVEEICRAFRVMPIMVGFADKTATYASAEQMFLAHVVHTLAPWYERIEESIDCNLLTEEDLASGVYSKFVVEGLLRGAMKDRAEFLSKLSTNGIMTRNEARATLELNPIAGLDEPLTPSNLTDKPEPAEPPAQGA